MTAQLFLISMLSFLALAFASEKDWFLAVFCAFCLILVISCPS